MIKRIRIAGFGGQGVMLIGEILAYAATLKDLNSIFVPTYGPETRGGTANCMVTLSDKPIYSPIFTACDDLIALNEPSFIKFSQAVKPDGFVLYNSSLVKANPTTKVQMKGIPANDLAMELGELKTMNIIVLGTYLKHLGLFDHETIITALRYFFGPKKEHLIPINQKALQIGEKQ